MRSKRKNGGRKLERRSFARVSTFFLLFPSNARNFITNLSSPSQKFSNHLGKKYSFSRTLFFPFLLFFFFSTKTNKLARLVTGEARHCLAKIFFEMEGEIKAWLLFPFLSSLFSQEQPFRLPRKVRSGTGTFRSDTKNPAQREGKWSSCVYGCRSNPE